MKSHNEIICVVLHKIRLKKVNDDHWICIADEKAEGQGVVATTGKFLDGAEPSGILS